MTSHFRTIIRCISIGIIVRWGVAFFPYSGQGEASKFGHFEAHRHWMEITANLPLMEWYYNSSVNNVGYWGLDHPPLTAYHHFALGHLIKFILPESVDLIESRGYESPFLKFLMRLTVSASDILIPALVAFHLKYSVPQRRFSTWVTLLLPLLAPPIIMVDYGHHQYNCVCLGLTVWAVFSLFSHKIHFAAFLFTLAVNYKQMALYYGVPFYTYLVATVIWQRCDFKAAYFLFGIISSTTWVLWRPFQLRMINVWTRVFPFERGIFEDRVASLWYILDLYTPFKTLLPNEKFIELSAKITLLILSNSTLHHFARASCHMTKLRDLRKAFLLHLLNGSILCFLIAFQVNAKTIIFPTLAAVLLIPLFPFTTVWFISAASFSLYPLFYKERSHLALLITTGLFLFVAHKGNLLKSMKCCFFKLLFYGSLGGYFLLIFGLHFIKPPKKMPEFFQDAITVYSFGHFVLFSFFFHWEQFCIDHWSHQRDTESDNHTRLHQ